MQFTPNSASFVIKKLKKLDLSCLSLPFILHVVTLAMCDQASWQELGGSAATSGLHFACLGYQTVRRRHIPLICMLILI